MFFYRPSPAQSHYSRGKLDHIRPTTTILIAHLYLLHHVHCRTESIYCYHHQPGFTCEIYLTGIHSEENPRYYKVGIVDPRGRCGRLLW